MQIWSFAINADPKRPDVATGFVRAETVTQALALIGDAGTNLYPLPGNTEWSGGKSEFVQMISPSEQERSGAHERDCP